MPPPYFQNPKQQADSLLFVWDLVGILVRDFDDRYATVSRGMSGDDVMGIMRGGDYRTGVGTTAFWDDELQGSVADAKVKSAIRYTVKTCLYPVTFEFTFDGAGRLVGRHRYD